MFADNQLVQTSAVLSPTFISTPRRHWIILITVCILSALLGRFCYLNRPLDNDAAIFIYMGKMVSEGGRLGHDLIDNKFPTVGLMTSVLWKTLGTCWPAYIAFQTALSFCAAWMLGRMAARHFGPHAQWPTLLFALVYLNFTRVVFGGFQLETVQVFFTVLAARSALIAMDSDNPADSFLAGLCAGCAAMLKPTGLMVLSAAAIGLWIRHRQNRFGIRAVAHMTAAAVGVGIPALVAVIYLLRTNLLKEMPALWHQISTYAAQSAWAFEDLQKPLIVALFLGFPMLVRGVIGRHQRAENNAWPATPIVTFALLWLIVEIAGVVMQRRLYLYHLLPIIPPAALVFGLLPRFPRPVPLGIALAPAILLSIFMAGNVIALTAGGNHPLPATEYLATHAKPGDAVWIDSWPRLILETNLKPGARLPFTFLFANYDRAGLDYSATMIRDFERIKPEYIFLPVPLDQRVQYQLDSIVELARRPLRSQNYAAGWHRIQQYTLDHYDKQAIVGGEMVYHRRPSTTGTAEARTE